MIVECACGQEIQVPDRPPAGAVYVCNRCLRALPIAGGAEPIRAAGKNRGKRFHGFGAGAVAIALVVLCAVLYYNTPPAETGPTAESAASPPGAVPSPSATLPNPPEDEVVARADVPASAAPSEPASPAKAREDEIIQQDAGLLGNPELENDYQEINDRYFDNQLPAIPVLWEWRLEEVGPLIAKGYVMGGLASSRPELILLNPRNRDNPAALQRVLCHEMIHIYLYTRHQMTAHHGPAFQREWQRLLHAGAFQGIVATGNERSKLQERLKSESSHLSAESAGIEQASAALDLAGRDIGRQKQLLEQQHEELNQRIVRANQQGEGWPAREEMAAYQERARALNRKIADFRARVAALNARVASYNAASKRFNQEAARFRLMMEGSEGLNDSPLIPQRSELGPRP